MSLAKKVAVAVKNALIAENFNAVIYVNTERDDVWVTTHPVWSDPATRNDWDEVGSIEGYHLDGYTVEELEAFAADDAPEHWGDWAQGDLDDLDD